MPMIKKISRTLIFVVMMSLCLVMTTRVSYAQTDPIEDTETAIIDVTQATAIAQRIAKIVQVGIELVKLGAIGVAAYYVYTSLLDGLPAGVSANANLAENPYASGTSHYHNQDQNYQNQGGLTGDQIDKQLEAYNQVDEVKSQDKNPVTGQSMNYLTNSLNTMKIHLVHTNDSDTATKNVVTNATLGAVGIPTPPAKDSAHAWHPTPETVNYVAHQKTFATAQSAATAHFTKVHSQRTGMASKGGKGGMTSLAKNVHSLQDTSDTVKQNTGKSKFVKKLRAFTETITGIPKHLYNIHQEISTTNDMTGATLTTANQGMMPQLQGQHQNAQRSQPGNAGNTTKK